jgi:hypothetical protein
MIPSGYKEDVVYSPIPTDGSGDLSFTRASNGTRVNSAGLVEVCPWNLAGYSEDFANAYWGLSGGGTITSNTTTAPNGTLTADTFTSVGTQYLYNGSFNLPIGEFTQSVYAKANTISSIRLEFVTSGFARGAACIFDLSNGTAGTLTIYGGVSGFTATIENVGNGWYRCSIGGTLTIADTYFWEVSITTGSIFVWGAQLNIGSTAKPYFPTTDRLNVPRLTYQNGGGGCPSLLLEKQSTNIVKYSQDISNTSGSYWGDGSSGGTATITANYATSPDGTQNATRLQLNEGSLYAVWQQVISTTAGTAYSYSIWLKAVSGTPTILFLYDGTANQNVTLTNEWVRYTFTFTGGTLAIARFGCWSSVWGTSTSADILAWGAQLEASSYVTTLIPTTSASATRVADACFRNSYAGGITSEGTIFADFEYLRTDGGYATPCLIINGSNYIYMFVISNTIRANCTNGGVIQSQIISSTVTPNTRYKVAARFKTNDFSLYVNGALIGTDTSGTMPTFSTSFNTYVGTDSSLTEPVGKLNELVIFPVGLTNSELASLTTI